MTTTVTIREQVATTLLDHAAEAAVREHQPLVHTLYVLPTGDPYWAAGPSDSSWDALPGTADRVKPLYRTGTGSCRCDCADCRAGVDPADWAAGDAGELEPELQRRLADIPVGYFADEHLTA